MWKHKKYKRAFIGTYYSVYKEGRYLYLAERTRKFMLIASGTVKTYYFSSPAAAKKAGWYKVKA